MDDLGISARAVTRVFRSGGGVRHVDLHVAAGEVHALVGLNGAGKTTVMRLLLGMLRPDSGTVFLGGVPLSHAGAEVWSGVGFLVDAPFGYPDLDVRTNLHLAALLRGLTDDGARVREALTAWDLQRYARTRVKRLSTGNRQRLGLAVALQHAPRLIILDEPNTALDPRGTILLRDAIRRRAAAGSAVLLSSHHLDEVARLADRISVLNRGRFVGEIDPNGTGLEQTLFEMLLADDEQGGLA